VPAENQPEPRRSLNRLGRLFPVPGKGRRRLWHCAVSRQPSRFPKAVRDAMQATGAAATCVAVQLNGDDWEAALFFQLAGAECKADRRAIKQAKGPLAVGMESDLVETDYGAVVILRSKRTMAP